MADAESRHGREYETGTLARATAGTRGHCRGSETCESPGGSISCQRGATIGLPCGGRGRTFESCRAHGFLAVEAATGDTRDTFAREHAKALRKLLGKVRPAIEEPRLATVADDVDRTLAELARTPGDRARSAGAKRKLERAAKAAEELAQ